MAKRSRARKNDARRGRAAAQLPPVFFYLQRSMTVAHDIQLF
jgi:hypothetical protein